MSKKKLIAMFAIVAILSSTITVLANSGLQTITAQLNYDISVVYNGQKQTLTDANGNTVVPISYNGSTYVPIRAFSNLVGEPVNWEPNTNTITVGSEGVQPVSIFTMSGLSTTKYSWIITDATDLVYTGSDATSTYSNGLVFDIWNSSASVGSTLNRMIQFPVSGYSTVTFTATADVDAVVRVYDQDANVLTSFDVAAGSIVTKEISISNATTISFGADAQKAGSSNNGTLKVFDATVK